MRKPELLGFCQVFGIGKPENTLIMSPEIILVMFGQKIGHIRSGSLGFWAPNYLWVKGATFGIKERLFGIEKCSYLE